jgi:glycosyltransferase involved in cell wall biosynthesis
MPEAAMNGRDKERTHLLFLAPELGIGGAQTHLIRYANWLRATGYRVTIIAVGVPNHLESILNPGVARYILSSRLRNPRLWWRLVQLLRSLSPDVVVGWSLYCNVAACMASFFYHAPRLVLVELNYPPALRRTMSTAHYMVTRCLTRWLFARADVVAANSEDALHVLREWAPRIKDCRRVLNPLDFEQIDDLAGQNDLPPAVAKANGEILILGIGRILLIHKGFDVLVKACARLRDLPAWKLVIVGSGPDEDRLRSLITAAELANRVILLPAVTNPFPFYRAADIVVLPSRYEGFPNVLFEAMALGKATISADCKCGPREMTEAGRYGRLVAVDDDGALAQELQELMGNATARTKLGMDAKRHIRSKYSREAVLEALVACLEQRSS